LRLAARGHTNAQIAQALGGRKDTVKKHVEHILIKLGVKNRTEAAVRAVGLGLIPESTQARRMSLLTRHDPPGVPASL